MMKYLLPLILCFYALTSFAQSSSAENIRSIDVSRLTPEQRAQLLGSVTQMQNSSTTNISETVRTEASKWGELGVGMGRAAVAAAKEVGMAANDFVATPLGKVTMAVVIYKVVGHEAVKLVVGSAVLVFFLSLGLIFFTRRKGPIEYDYAPMLFGLWQKRVVKKYELDSDYVIGYFIAGGISCALGLLIGLNIMF